MRARSATGAEAKLNAIADAIDEFADYIELMEHQLRNIETKVRKLEMELL
jgi:Mg2+ and Co2+ transporter CorA